MRKSIVILSIAAPIVVVLEAGFMAYWASGRGAVGLDLRVPDRDDEPTPGSAPFAAPRNTGKLMPGQASPSDLPGLWPQFRGPGRTAVAPPAEKLPARLPEKLPVLWKIEVGEGHAGVAVRNGRVYIHDYDRERSEDAIRCLSLADGGEIWRYTYYVKVKRNHGMSRTIPAVTDDHVVALGPKCHLTCLDARTGERRWTVDLVKEHGTTVPPWYAGQCALIDGGAAIVAPGADPLLMAVELAEKKIRWKTPNPGGWRMTHTSVTPMDYRGERQYVYASSRGVVGVRASDGRVRWEHPGWRNKIAAVASPVVVDSERLFFSGGYGAGCSMIRLKGELGNMEVEELWRLAPSAFGAAQHTPILYGGHLYGVMPPNTANAGELACLDLDGKRLWTSGAALRFGLGPYIIVDGKLLVLADMSGDLHLFEATPEGCRHLAKWHVLDGHDAWAPMALAGGRLILRDLTQLVCLDLTGGRR